MSNTLGRRFCLATLDEASLAARPEVFNTDQSSQLSSREYTGRLKAAGIAVRRDGRRRALDNVFVKRFWRSAKYEYIHIIEYYKALDLK
jgi:putative transposase